MCVLFVTTRHKNNNSSITSKLLKNHIEETDTKSTFLKLDLILHPKILGCKLYFFYKVS